MKRNRHSVAVYSFLCCRASSVLLIFIPSETLSAHRYAVISSVVIIKRVPRHGGDFYRNLAHLKRLCQRRV